MIELKGDFKDYSWPENVVLKQLYSKVKKRSEKIRVEFNLSEREFCYFCFSSCSYCGSAPNNKFTYKGNDFYYSGIDRKNSQNGYVFSNCCSSCWDCNKLKYTEEDILFFIRIMDISERFQEKHSLEQQIKLWQENMKTFLDKNMEN